MLLIAAITIANKNFSQHSLVHETIRIKSGAWDDAGVFIYSTLNHVKYCLAQGCVPPLTLSFFPLIKYEFPAIMALSAL
jgi:hypothetical protein